MEQEPKIGEVVLLKTITCYANHSDIIYTTCIVMDSSDYNIVIEKYVVIMLGDKIRLAHIDELSYPQM